MSFASSSRTLENSNLFVCEIFKAINEQCPQKSKLSLTLTSNVGEGDKIEIDTRNLVKIIPKMYHSN